MKANQFKATFLFLGYFSSAVSLFSQSPVSIYNIKPNIDTYVDASINNVNKNFGTDSYLYSSTLNVGGEASPRRSLVQFDVSSIPYNAYIISAYLNLYGYSHVVNTNSKSVLEKVTSSWNENTVTWNTQPSVISTGAVYIAAPTSSTQNYSIDVSSFVKGWVNLAEGNPNYGFRMRLQTEISGYGLGFYSSDYTNAAYQPSVSIQYTTQLGMSWKSLVNLTASTTGGLIKGLTSTSTWNDMTATSLNVLPANTDGFILHRVNTSSDQVRIGFSSGFEQTADKMDYCVEIKGTTVTFYKQGTYYGAPFSAPAGTVVILKRSGNNMQLYLNGNTTATYSMACDANMALRAKITCWRNSTDAVEIGETKVSFGNPLMHSLMPSNFNYIYSIIPRIASLSVPGRNIYHETADYAEEIKYFDGIGRLLEDVNIGSSPSGNSIIVPHAYDNTGREAIKYLPYSFNDNEGSYDLYALNSNQPAFYSSSGNPDIPVTRTPFAETLYDQSPLNRTIEQSYQGETWKIASGASGLFTYNGYLDYSTKKAAGEFTGDYPGHTSIYSYGTNDDNDVYNFTVNSDGNLVKTGWYAANSLNMTVSRDENWTESSINKHSIREYKDKQGHLILKRTYDDTGNALNTGYVYDNFGLLRYMIPPAAYADAITKYTYGNTLDKSDILATSYFYYYEYDGRHRMTLKKLPGADPIYMVYDLRDRLVATQDGMQHSRSPRQWTFTKYDIYNRTIVTGIYSSNAEPQDLQTTVNGFTGSKLYEVSGTALKGYTNNSFPTNTLGSGGTLVTLTSTDLLTVIYFDNYTYPGAVAFNTSYNISDYNDVDGTLDGYYDMVSGQVTGSCTRVMNDLTKDNWITTTSYYDNKYRVIQSSYIYSTNESTSLFGGGYGEITAYHYTFDGRVTMMKNKQAFNGLLTDATKTTEVTKYFVYDNGGRLTQTYNEITGDATNGRVLEAENIYNELGQVKNKRLHKNTSGTALQDIAYKYNIRGWLTAINDPNSLGSDLFGMKFYYEQTDNHSGAFTIQPQYNGNIAAVNWNDAHNTGFSKLCSYSYDALNRLTKAQRGEIWPGNDWGNVTPYTEPLISYDANGNIKSLQRNGSAGTLIDDLTYTYLNGGKSNQLESVSDNPANPDYGQGFVDFNVPGVDDYAYDLNGNAKQDFNKGLYTITYNYLNLPNVITKAGYNSVTYIYTANGEKLVAAVNTNGTTTNRYYLGSFEYDNNKAFSLLKMEEGIITKPSGSYVYEYYLTDHLGNVRVTFSPGTSGPVLEQATDYYSFGMIASQYNLSTGNNYLYNGQESQKNLTTIEWYDYGFRMNDATIGRWLAPDPMAERYSDQSQYAYVNNNPISFVDLLGLEGDDPFDFSDMLDLDIPVGPCDTYLGDGVIADYNVTVDEGGWTTQTLTIAAQFTTTITAPDGMEPTTHPDNYTTTYTRTEPPAYLTPISGQLTSNLDNGVIKPWNPSFTQSWAMSSGLSGMAYKAFDDIWVGIQTPFLGPDATHIGGSAVVGNDRVNGIIGLAMWLIPGGEETKAAEEGSAAVEDLISNAQELYPKKAGTTELHHIFPKYLGGEADGALVPLDGAYHQVITNEFRSIYPYGLPYPSLEESLDILEKVYTKYPLPGGY